MIWLPLIFWLLLLLACIPAFLRLALPPLPPDDNHVAADCVLVIRAGCKKNHQGAELSTTGLLRLEAGMSLAKRENLPLLLSGGPAGKDGLISEAELMAERVKALQHDTGKQHLWSRLTKGVRNHKQPERALTIWQETESRNFHESVRFSTRLLDKKHVYRIYVVTNQAKLCRTILCLKKQGVSAKGHACNLLPAPGWLPHAGALAMWPEVIHEWGALFWDALRRRI